MKFSKDFILLILAALLVTAPMIFLPFLGVPEKISKDVIFYVFMFLGIFLVLELLMPFVSDYRYFGFKTKFPMRLGALINAVLVILTMIILKDRVEMMHTFIKITLLTLELFSWLAVMYAIGHLLRGKKSAKRIS